jgi:uncharacterized protein YjbI with pentapeptide repeats
MAKTWRRLPAKTRLRRVDEQAICYFYATLCYSTLRYATLRYATLRYSTLLNATLCYSTLYYTTLRYATLRYATLRYATLRYYMLLYATVRYSYDTPTLLRRYSTQQKLVSSECLHSVLLLNESLQYNGRPKSSAYQVNFACWGSVLSSVMIIVRQQVKGVGGR